MTPTYHTPEQLRTQLDIAQRSLEADLVRMRNVMHPDWELAKEYGEEIRQNHIRTIQMRIDAYARRIDAINLALPRVNFN